MRVVLDTNILFSALTLATRFSRCHLPRLARRALRSRHLADATRRNPPRKPLSKVSIGPATRSRRRDGQQSVARPGARPARCRDRSRRSRRRIFAGHGHRRRRRLPRYGRPPRRAAATRPHPAHADRDARGVLQGSIVMESVTRRRDIHRRRERVRVRRNFIRAWNL